MNSFSGVERAVEVEFIRQVGELQAGRTILQQTMLWDAGAGEVRPSRTKEGSHDYRYFPEPDLPPLVLAPDWIEQVRHDLPELPAARRLRFAKDYSLGEYDVDVLTASPHLADYFESVARAHGDAKTAANWVMGEVLARLRSTGQKLQEFRVRPADLAGLLGLVSAGVVTLTAAKQIFVRMIATGDPPAQIAERDGLIRIDDEEQLAAWVDDVLLELSAEATRYRQGETRLRGVLVGAVMKKSGGRADARKVGQLLEARLES